MLGRPAGSAGSSTFFVPMHVCLLSLLQNDNTALLRSSGPTLAHHMQLEFERTRALHIEHDSRPQ